MSQPSVLLKNVNLLKKQQRTTPTTSTYSKAVKSTACTQNDDAESGSKNPLNSASVMEDGAEVAHDEDAFDHNEGYRTSNGLIDRMGVGVSSRRAVLRGGKAHFNLMSLDEKALSTYRAEHVKLNSKQRRNKIKQAAQLLTIPVKNSPSNISGKQMMKCLSTHCIPYDSGSL